MTLRVALALGASMAIAAPALSQEPEAEPAAPEAVEEPAPRPKRPKPRPPLCDWPGRARCVERRHPLRPTRSMPRPLPTLRHCPAPARALARASRGEGRCSNRPIREQLTRPDSTPP